MQQSKQRAILFAVASLVLAGVAGILFLHKVNEIESQFGQMAKMYLAKKGIQPREVLTPALFEEVEIPLSYLPKSAVTDLKSIEQYVAIVPLEKGDLLTTNILRRKTELISDQHRLVVLQQSAKVFFDQEVDRWDRVDILVSRQNKQGPETYLLLKDVLVVMGIRDQNGKFRGAGLELPLQQAAELIHEENFALSIRVLKAPQAKVR